MAKLTFLNRFLFRPLRPSLQSSALPSQLPRVRPLRELPGPAAPLELSPVSPPLFFANLGKHVCHFCELCDLCDFYLCHLCHLRSDSGPPGWPLVLVDAPKGPPTTVGATHPDVAGPLAALAHRKFVTPAVREGEAVVVYAGAAAAGAA